MHQRDGSIYLKIKPHGSLENWEQILDVLFANLSVHHSEGPKMLRRLGATSTLRFRGDFGTEPVGV